MHPSIDADDKAFLRSKCTDARVNRTAWATSFINFPRFKL